MYRRIRTGRYRTGKLEKLFGPSPKRLPAEWRSSQATVIWLHGVSVGEIQLLAPIVAGLKRLLPTARFAISTTTESGMELAKKLFTDDLLFFYPLDFSFAVNRALDLLKPSLIVLGELELWPNLLTLAHKRGIPTSVINGRLSERSYLRYQAFLFLVRPMFERLDLVLAQTETYAKRFIECGAGRDRTTVVGSVKFDNVTFDRQAVEVCKFRAMIGQHSTDEQAAIIWTMGSTQIGEEDAAVDAFCELRATYPNLRLIIVPRHPERFDQVYALLCQRPVRVIRRSAVVQLEIGQWDVLLVDTIGELRWWWGVTDIAIVGGSFGARGGQNMLEPAAFGANVAFGPNTSNFRDVVERLLEADAAVRLFDLNGIRPWVQQQLDSPEIGVERGKRAQEVVASQQGALSKTCCHLERLISGDFSKLSG